MSSGSRSTSISSSLHSRHSNSTGNLSDIHLMTQVSSHSRSCPSLPDLLATIHISHAVPKVMDPNTSSSLHIQTNPFHEPLSSMPMHIQTNPFLDEAFLQEQQLAVSQTPKASEPIQNLTKSTLRRKTPPNHLDLTKHGCSAPKPGFFSQFSTEQPASGTLHMPKRMSQGMFGKPIAFQASSGNWMNGVWGCLKPFISTLGKQLTSSNPSQTVDDWQVRPEQLCQLRWISSGSQGAVFTAMYGKNLVAVKKPNEPNDTELQHLRHLSHPNIIRVLGVSNKPNNCCIIMEYCAGGCLYDRLKQPSAVPLPLLCEWAIQVAQGMAYLHANRVIHRDLKSPNVLIDREGNWEYGQPVPLLKISDFGTAARNPMSSVQMNYAGTVCWMAPEVIRNEKCSDRVDVWSYGVLLWELLTCQVPYASVESSRVILGVGAGVLSLPIPATCPSAFASLLRRCWNLNACDRPSFACILGQLNDALNELRQTFFVLLDLQQCRQAWIDEVRNELACARTSSQTQHTAIRELQLVHAKQLRDHYMNKLEKVNQLYAEAKKMHCVLEQRRKKVIKREIELGLCHSSSVGEEDWITSISPVKHSLNNKNIIKASIATQTDDALCHKVYKNKNNESLNSSSESLDHLLRPRKSTGRKVKKINHKNSTSSLEYENGSEFLKSGCFEHFNESDVINNEKKHPNNASKEAYSCSMHHDSLYFDSASSPNNSSEQKDELHQISFGSYVLISSPIKAHKRF